MDGGAKQEEMARRLKREVKDNAPYRRVDRSTGAGSDDWIMLPQARGADAVRRQDNIGTESPAPMQRRVGCSHLGLGESAPERSDAILIMFYLEHVLPFLFPFYRPSVSRGGKAWILEMMISSPVVRQATLCQGRFFFCLAQGTDNRQVICETVFAQVREAFDALGEAIRVINGGSGVADNLHEAVRMTASIVHMVRFETAALSFENCHTHLNAALALFEQLLESSVVPPQAVPGQRFESVMKQLGPPSWIAPARHLLLPSPEQAAFSFSTALLLFDNIIASTLLQERPRLYEFHLSLLSSVDGKEPVIDLEAATGSQNWTLLQIGEIAALDAWKQKCLRAGKLSVIELVGNATTIKEVLEAQLGGLEHGLTTTRKEPSSLLDLLTPKEKTTSQNHLITRIWAHAALVYLLVEVSGWQPASIDVRHHVSQVINLLAHQISPPAMLRTMVWPFCVAGCLAESGQEAQIREMVERLQPSIVFGPVRKALEIMENAWSNRDGDTSRDLASCFRSQGGLVLLV
jgi:hypothetical protein